MTHCNDGRLRELFALGPSVRFNQFYVNEAMRVLELNRGRPRGHAGRIFLARDIKIRRDIKASRNLLDSV